MKTAKNILTFIGILLFVTAVPVYSQTTPFFGDSTGLGYAIAPVRVGGMDTLYFDVDTVEVKSATGMFHRWLDSALAGVSGGRVYISDATNYAGTITGDTANGDYILHYPARDLTYHSYSSTFSNNATDSCLLNVGSGETYLLAYGGDFPFTMNIITDAGGVLQTSFDALNSLIGTDSTAISFHLVKSGGQKYITVWKHKLTVIPILTATVTTAGFMVLKQQITLTLKADGSATFIRWGIYMSRNVR